jgi:hypothetical protein
MTEPAYVGLEAADIPAVSVPGATLHLVSDAWDGTQGPIEPLADIRLMLVRLDAGGELFLPVEQGRTIFLYTVRGDAKVAGSPVPQGHLAELEDDGDGVALTSAAGATLLFGHARPFGEPIVSHGPFVMNSREEIVEAIQDYQAGRFGSL